MGMVIMNGVEYSSSPKDGFPPMIYSDEEREVGVWRDGKPLYQKTIKYSNVSADSNYTVSLDVSALSIDRLVKTDFSSLNTSGDQVGSSYYVVATDMLRGWLTNNNATFTIQRGRDHAITNNGYVTFIYTKITDVAGSGKYTTYGGLAHHYSTTEQVVGTWTDGKPVYERSWIFPSEIIINPSSWTSLGIPNTNIDLIVNAIGTSEWGISRIFSVSSKVDNTNLVALCTRNGNDSLKYLTLQYTKTTD